MKSKLMEARSRALAMAMAPEQAWEPYRSSAEAPWNLSRVAHLHRRAGFAAPMETLERDLKDGPTVAVDRLLSGEPKTAGGQTREEFESQAEQLATQLGNNLQALQAVWLYRMIHSPSPLAERLTLFWHDHFATSFDKVNDAGLMRQQNQLLRQHALGKFSQLLIGIGKDPAMLVWLDSTSNRKRKPNENYAREVMELFALGRGKYTEKDIQEAARAFTGRFVVEGEFQFVPSQHDSGSKTILGQKGPFNGDDVVDVLMKQPACSEFLCGKLARFFLTDVDSLSPELIGSLAKKFAASGYDIRVVVETILRSRIFYDNSTIRRKIKGPVEFAVSLVRSLRLVDPTVRLYQLAEVCESMGQRLFAPPSVAGWDEGPAWINTTTMLARSNLVLALSGGGELGRTSDGSEWKMRDGVENSDQVIEFYLDLLVQDGLNGPARQKLIDTVKKAAKGGDRPDLNTVAKTALATIAAAPEFQLA